LAVLRWRAPSLILSRLKADNDDQQFGIEIVPKAVQMPVRQIARTPERMAQ
jgi:chaperonin GroEL (HSP60 family)